MRFQYLLKYLCPVVERDAEMSDLPLCLESISYLIGIATLEFREDILVLRMHQIEIKVIYTAGLELTFKKRPDFFFLIKVMGRKLVGENIPFTGIPAGEAFLQCRLALTSHITVSRIEIVEAPLQKHIYHFLHLGGIYLFVTHGQAHTAKAQFLVNLRIKLLHVDLLLDGFLLPGPSQEERLSQ